MDIRTRITQFLKRALRVGKPSDSFFSRTGTSKKAGVDAARAEADAYTRGMQGGG